MNKIAIALGAVAGVIVGGILAAIILGTIFYWLWPTAREVFGIFSSSTPANLSWGGWVCFSGFLICLASIFNKKKKK
jgi:hypothetical protein